MRKRIHDEKLKFALIIWAMIVILILISTGCSEGYETIIQSNWSRSVENLENPWEGDPHEKCMDRHRDNVNYMIYVDPYSKKEYCLPEGFSNMKNLHVYLVED